MARSSSYNKNRTSQSIREVDLSSLSIEKNGGAAQYQQLYRQLRGMIMHGVLRPGMRLPSTQALSSDLGVARNTVITAYELLETEGYIETAHGTLARIADIPSFSGVGTRRLSMKMAGNLSGRGRSLVEHDYQIGSFDRVMLQHGMPDMREFPVNIWRRLISARLKTEFGDLYGYHSFSGHRLLREAIASYINTSRGVVCGPDQVWITNGAQGAFNLLAYLFIDPGDEVLMEEPGYIGAQAAFSAAGARLQPLFVDHSGWNLNKAESFCPRLIYLTPSCQFPLGVTMRMEQRIRITEYARRKNALIIEDDFDSEYRFSSKSIPSLQGIDRYGRVIYVGSFSKTLFPSLRTGFIIFPGEDIDEISKAGFLLGKNPSLFIQAALGDFIREGHFSRHLRRMRRIYGRRRSRFIQLASDQLGKWLAPVESRAGLQTLWKLSPGMDDKHISRLAAGASLEVAPLSTHYQHGSPQQGLILGYAAMDEEITLRSLAILGSILESCTSSF